MAEVKKNEEVEVEEARGRLGRGKLLLGGLLVVLVGLAYYYRGVFVVAMVDGKPITRLSLVRELERQGGGTALDGLITEALIEKGAREQGISVLPKEVDEEIEKIEEELAAQGQELEQVLGAQAMDEEDLRKQVRLQRLVEKMVAEEIAVSDEEASEYIENYSSFFPEGMSDEEKLASAREQLAQQKMAEEFYAWLEEARAGADIKYFVEY